jgi:hypothetical protein
LPPSPPPLIPLQHAFVQGSKKLNVEPRNQRCLQENLLLSSLLGGSLPGSGLFSGGLFGSSGSLFGSLLDVVVSEIRNSRRGAAHISVTIGRV